jgi:hypothetical protein
LTAPRKEIVEKVCSPLLSGLKESGTEISTAQINLLKSP